MDSHVSLAKLGFTMVTLKVGSPSFQSLHHLRVSNRRNLFLLADHVDQTEQNQATNLTNA